MGQKIKEIEGQLSAGGLRFAIVVARFNSFVTDRLLAGAIDALRRTGADESLIEIVRIPGAWEFPVTVKAVAALKRHDAIVCLGAVIRATRHTSTTWRGKQRVDCLVWRWIRGYRLYSAC